MIAIALTISLSMAFLWSSRVLEAMNRYWCACCTLVFKSRRSLWGQALCHKNYFSLTFKGNCVNSLLELIFFFILNHSVTSKQPHKIVQMHMRHPVEQKKTRYKNPLQKTSEKFLFSNSTENGHEIWLLSKKFGVQVERTWAKDVVVF